MKKVFNFVLFLSFVLYVSAVPVQRTPTMITLSDGSQIIVLPYGDEHYSWYETLDGQVVEATESGYIISSQTPQQARRNMLKARQLTARYLGSQSSAALPAIGSPRIPVILVNFQDSVFSVKPTQEELYEYYNLYCNGTRDGNLYQEHGSYGSIRDYYSDQSQKQFTPEFVIIGDVTLDQPESYYGGNSGNNKDTRFSDFCKQSVTKAMASYEVDWTQFNNRGKNRVDMVFFVFAGCGEHNGGAATTLWPKWQALNFTINDVKFFSVLCGSENRPVKSNGAMVDVKPDGIGVLCHEMNHALGLPDFYDTNYNAFGMDLWSIMDYGQYASNGYMPVSMTSYEREFMGWLTIEELTASQWVTLDPLGSDGKAYKIVNDENANEYYILENRQETGWDQALCKFGHGLQVTHVDYNSSRWNSNTVNTDQTHQRMTIIAANNRYIGTYLGNDVSGADLIETWSGNLYPYITEQSGVTVCNDSLTAYSTPAATVFTSAGTMNKDLHAISENDDMTVSFYFGNDFAVGITSPDTESSTVRQPASIFDLSGRRVSHPRRGLYIVNGKKVFIP